MQVLSAKQLARKQKLARGCHCKKALLCKSGAITE